MAYQQDDFAFGGFTAAADYSTNQNCAVVVTAAAKTVTLCSAAGQRASGILSLATASGAAALVQCRGIAPWKAGGTVDIGDLLVSDSAGRCVNAALTPGWVMGEALEAGAVDETISVRLFGSPQNRAAMVIALPITLVGVTAADVATSIVPGFAGKIIKTQFVVTTAVTTGGKAATLNLEIGTTDLTGGVIALTSANSTPLGVVIQGTAVSALNSFTAASAISVEASSVTAFSEGAGTLYITVLQD